MKRLDLYFQRPPQEPAGNYILWSGRDAKNAILLEKLVEDNLVKIRSEHMQWAYECGQAEVLPGKTLADLLAGEPSMWWTSLLYERHPRLSPWLYPVYKLRCLEILLEENRITELGLRGFDGMLKKALQKLCKAKNIKTFSEPLPTCPGRVKTPLLPYLYNLVPRPLQAIIRFLHWLITVRRHLPALSSFTTTADTATIVTYFPNIDAEQAKNGRFHSRYWENLHQLINSQAARRDINRHFCHWIFIRFPSPDFSLKKCISLCRQFAANGQDGQSFNYLEEFLTTSLILKSLRRWLFLTLQSYRIQKNFKSLCHFRNSSLNFWQFAKLQWADSTRGWRCLERCLLDYAFRNYTCMCGRQIWILFVLENCPWERMLTIHCHAVPDNGPVVGVQHSTIRPTDFRYFDDARTFSNRATSAFQPDYICGNGQGAISQWLANAMPESRLFKTEALRYLYLNRMLEECKNAPFSPQRLLILTSFFASETQFHLELAFRAIKAGLLDNYEIVLKPHPYYDVRWWLAGLPAEKRTIITLAKGTLESEFIHKPLVWASNSTTSALEAAYLRLPLMVMLPDSDFDLCPIQNVPGLARSATLKDVEEWLARPSTPELPTDYLELDPGLRQWHKLLTALETFKKHKAKA